MLTPRSLTSLAVAALLAGTAFMSVAAHAGATQLSSAAQLLPGDVLAAFPMNSNGHLLEPGPFVLASGGNTLTFASGSAFDIQDGGDGLPPGSERLYNIDSFTPDTITFAQGVDEFGFQGVGAYLAPYTLTYDVYDQSTLLGEYTGSGVNTATASDVAPFLGARATGGDVITRVVVSAVTGGDPNNFSIGAVTYRSHVVAAPEPSQGATLGLGVLGAAGLIARKRISRRA